MTSKIMIRSSGSSIRTLIHRHLRPTVAVTNILSETPPESIYNWQYLLPNAFVNPQTVNYGGRFSCDAAGGYTLAEEAVRGRRKFEPAEENNSGEESNSEDDFQDDVENEWSVSDVEDDNDDDDYEDDE